MLLHRGIVAGQQQIDVSSSAVDCTSLTVEIAEGGPGGLK